MTDSVAKPLVETPYPFVSTSFVEKELIQDMILQFYGGSPELDKKIEEVYSSYFGKKFLPALAESGINVSYLHGPPGQGKTSAYRSAAKEVCRLLDLNFVDNPSDNYDPKSDNSAIVPDYDPTRKDFLFVSQEMSGEVSSASMGGIPAKVVEKNDDGTEFEYMAKLVNKRLALLGRAEVGMLLLDDFANASPPIQNVALSVVEEGRFQSMNLNNAYVGLTGNLGSLDKTNTSKSSSALDSRAKHYYIEDVPHQFRTRMIKRNADQLGDGGVLGFLEVHPELFKQMPYEKGGPFGTSRTWDKSISEVRRFGHRFSSGKASTGDRAAIGRNLFLKIGSVLGGSGAWDNSEEGRLILEKNGRTSIAPLMASYLSNYIGNVAPMAKDIIAVGAIGGAAMSSIEKELKNSENPHFAMQFADALTHYAATKVAENNGNIQHFEDVIDTVASGLSVIDDQQALASAADFLNQRLGVRVPENWMRITPAGRAVLNEDMEDRVKGIFQKNKGMGKSASELKAFTSRFNEYGTAGASSDGSHVRRNRKRLNDKVNEAGPASA